MFRSTVELREAEAAIVGGLNIPGVLVAIVVDYALDRRGLGLFIRAMTTRLSDAPITYPTLQYVTHNSRWHLYMYFLPVGGVSVYISGLRPDMGVHYELVNVSFESAWNFINGIDDEWTNIITSPIWLDGPPSTSDVRSQLLVKAKKMSPFDSHDSAY